MSLVKAIMEAEQLSEGTHEMRIMSPKDGDFKITWDPDDSGQVQSAKETFAEQRKKGMTAYEVGKKGRKAEVMKEFDPDANAIIFSPAPVGG